MTSVLASHYRSAFKPRGASLQLAGCILCGSSRRRAVRRFPHGIVACAVCGLAFAEPQPSEPELAAIYSAKYFEPFGYDPERQSLYRQMKQAWFSRLLGVAERHVVPGRLVDVGTGLGDLLTVGRSRGWNVQGVDPNEFAVDAAEEVVPRATFHGDLVRFGGEPDRFDLATFCDVLEHVRDPLRELREAARILRPGGYLLITTIDAGGWQACLAGRRWIHFLPEHLWYFNRESLTRLVATAGFEVAHWEVPRKIFNLRYVLGIFAHHSQSRQWKGVWSRILNAIPGFAQSALLPGLPEGQLLLARKPG
jgi:SAM-dependent methyltransferase